jgi:hypothetical protein
MRTREEQQREREKAWGDAVYDTWASGGNPDAVSRDQVDDVYYGDGETDPHLTAEIVTHRTLRRARRV